MGAQAGRAGDDERADETAELHRRPDHRPQRVGPIVDGLEQPGLPARHDLMTGDQHPAAGEQSRSTEHAGDLAQIDPPSAKHLRTVGAERVTGFSATRLAVAECGKWAAALSQHLVEGSTNSLTQRPERPPPLTRTSIGAICTLRCVRVAPVVRRRDHAQGTPTCRRVSSASKRQASSDAEDYRDTLGPALDKAAADGDIRLVIVIPTFEGIEPEAIWEDTKIGVKNWSAWKRVALTGRTSVWMAHAKQWFGPMSPGEIKHFPLAERVVRHRLGRPASLDLTPAVRRGRRRHPGRQLDAAVSGVWQTASTLLPSGSRTKAP